jgi:hypothetical protein
MNAGMGWLVQGLVGRVEFGCSGSSCGQDQGDREQ